MLLPKMINKTYSRPVATRQSAATATPPPPDHPPPPPPPATQVVTVDPKPGGDYAKVCVKSPDRDAEMSPGGTVRSSFKPTDNAKLYASPEAAQSYAFRAESEESPTHRGAEAPKKRSPTRANSMPPRPNRPQVCCTATLLICFFQRNCSRIPCYNEAVSECLQNIFCEEPRQVITVLIFYLKIEKGEIIRIAKGSNCLLSHIKIGQICF
jgi:hypothetical protein